MPNIFKAGKVEVRYAPPHTQPYTIQAISLQANRTLETRVVSQGAVELSFELSNNDTVVVHVDGRVVGCIIEYGAGFPGVRRYTPAAPDMEAKPWAMPKEWMIAAPALSVSAAKKVVQGADLAVLARRYANALDARRAPRPTARSVARAKYRLGLPAYKKVLLAAADNRDRLLKVAQEKAAALAFKAKQDADEAAKAALVAAVPAALAAPYTSWYGAVAKPLPSSPSKDDNPEKRAEKIRAREAAIAVKAAAEEAFAANLAAADVIDVTDLLSLIEKGLAWATTARFGAGAPLEAIYAVVYADVRAAVAARYAPAAPPVITAADLAALAHDRATARARAAANNAANKAARRALTALEARAARKAARAKRGEKASFRLATLRAAKAALKAARKAANEVVIPQDKDVGLGVFVALTLLIAPRPDAVLPDPGRYLRDNRDLLAALRHTPLFAVLMATSARARRAARALFWRNLRLKKAEAVKASKKLGDCLSTIISNAAANTRKYSTPISYTKSLPHGTPAAIAKVVNSNVGCIGLDNGNNHGIRNLASDAGSVISEAVEALSQGAGYANFMVMRFSSVIGDANLASPAVEVKSKALAIRFETDGGRWLPALLALVDFHNDRRPVSEQIHVGMDNCVLYEMDDKMDAHLMGSIGEALAMSGWFTPCRGFAVRGDLAELLISQAKACFSTVVEMRSYFRSLISTPAQNVYLATYAGLPVFISDLGMLGWSGNDGGAIMSNGLMVPHQDRSIRLMTPEELAEDKLFSGVLKGFTTNAHIVAKKVGENWHPIFIGGNEGLRDAARAAISRGKAAANKTPESWQFEVGGETYSVGIFHDLGKAKGRNVSALKKELKNKSHALVYGHVGVNILGYSIAQQNGPYGGEISFGWQITNLLSEQFIKATLHPDGLGAKKVLGRFEAALNTPNSVLSDLQAMVNTEALDGAESHNALTQAQKLIAALGTQGQRMTKLLSSGLGMKARAKHVQMMPLGGEFFIDHALEDKAIAFDKRNLWTAPAFMGRTPNQMHDTIRAPLGVHVQAVAVALKQLLTTTANMEWDNALGGYLADVPAAHCVNMKKFLQGFYNLGADSFALRAECLLAMLPTVADGAMIVDTELQKVLCGDNDGDQNMVSYDPLAVALALDCVNQYPAEIPQKEQDKSQRVETFHSSITGDIRGGLGSAWEELKSGNSAPMEIIAKFLNAPGNSPGQANVGGVTQCGGSANGYALKTPQGQFCNAAARRFADYVYAAQQPAIDRQKYYYITPSLIYWYKAKMYQGTGNTVPGGMFDPGCQHSCYVIQGHHGMTFADYKAKWRDLPVASEAVPMMGKLGNGGEVIMLETVDPNMMYANSGLYAFTAWTINALNVGLSYITPEEMVALAKLIPSEQDANWQAVYDLLYVLWADGRRDDGVEFLADSAETMAARWVWPRDVSGWQNASYMSYSNAPPAIKQMRAAIVNLRTEAFGAAGIDLVNDDRTLTERLADTNVVSILEHAAKGYFDSVDDKFTGVVTYRDIVTIFKALYRDYLGVKSDEEAGVSQSMRTQTDTVTSNADRLRMLRDALDGESVRALSIKGLSTSLQVWRNSLISGADTKMAGPKRRRQIAGLMAAAIKATQEILGEITDANVDTVSEHLANVLKAEGVTGLDVFRNWEKYQEYKKAQTGGEANGDKAVLRRKLDKTWDFLQDIEGLRDWLGENPNADKDTITAKIMGASEESSQLIISFLMEDVMGALDEAWTNVGRSFSRQSMIDLAIEVRTWARKQVEGNRITSMEDFVAKLKRNLLHRAKRSLNDLIFEKAKAAYSGRTEWESAEAQEQALAHFFENRRETLTEWRVMTMPLIGAGRAAKLVLDMLDTNSEQDDGGIDPREWLATWEEAVFGKHTVRTTDQDGATYEEEVEHLNAIIRTQLPVELMAEQADAMLDAGISLSLLGNIPKAFNLSDAREDGDGSPNVYTRKGYIDISSAWFKAALEKCNEEDVWDWLCGQFECGTGHVTTQEHLDMAYWSAGPYKAFHAGDEAVLEVQRFFESLYRESIVLDFEYSENAPEKQLIEDMRAAISTDDTPGNLIAFLQWSLRNTASQTIFMPPTFGSKLKTKRLVEGRVVERIDTESGDVTAAVESVTPFNIIRSYSFGMVGKADEQQRPDLPDEVVDFQRDVLEGCTVGNGQPYERKSYARGSSAASSAAQILAQLKNARAQAAEHPSEDDEETPRRSKSNFSKKDFEDWQWSNYPATDEIEVSNKSLPSLVEIAKAGLSANWNEDSWRWAHYPLFISPSTMWNIMGAMEKDEEGNPGPYAAINRKALKAIRTSSLRAFLANINAPMGKRSVTNAYVQENRDFSADNYGSVMDLLATLSETKGVDADSSDF